MRVRFPRLDMVYIQPHALLRPATACHAWLVSVFEQDLIPDLRPLVCIEKLPAGRVREMPGVRPTKADMLDQIEHGVRIHTSRNPDSHTSYLINRSAPSARSTNRL